MSEFKTVPPVETVQPEVMATSDAPPDNVISMMPSLVGAGNERVLSKEDYAELDKLLSIERMATMEAGNLLVEMESLKKRVKVVSEKVVESRADRDKMCLKLEEKYQVPKGVRWNFDYAKKAIIIQQPQKT